MTFAYLVAKCKDCGTSKRLIHINKAEYICEECKEATKK